MQFEISIYVLLFPSLPYPMPCIVVSSCIPVLSLWNAKNWLYPAIKCLETLILIITPINFIKVLMVIIVYLYASIP